MARNYTGRNENERNFIKIFHELTYRHNPWSVFRDFVNMSACSIANAADREESRWKRHEDLYLATVKPYTKEELEKFAELLGVTVMALEKNPAQDFLGALYMNLDFGSGWAGQFFTPWHIAEFMAKISFHESAISDELQKKGYISINDPCCGAGCMLIAAAHICREDLKINYQQQALFVGQDLDPIVARMCYIQLSLLGCPGYIVVGDSLARPTAGPVLWPTVHPDNDIWFTPMWFSEVWTIRVIGERCRTLFDSFGETAQQNQ